MNCCSALISVAHTTSRHHRALALPSLPYPSALASLRAGGPSALSSAHCPSHSPLELWAPAPLRERAPEGPIPSPTFHTLHLTVPWSLHWGYAQQSAHAWEPCGQSTPVTLIGTTIPQGLAWHLTWSLSVNRRKKMRTSMNQWWFYSF